MEEDIILLNTREAAKYLGIKYESLVQSRRMKRNFLIDYLKIGKVIRYKKSDLNDYINKHIVKLEYQSTEIELDKEIIMDINNIDPNKFYRRIQVCKFLGISQHTMSHWDLKERATLPVIRMGGLCKYLGQDILNYLKNKDK